MTFDIVQHQRRLAMALLDTEINGIKVDLDLCVNLGIELKNEIEVLTTQAQKDAAPEILLIELDQWAKEVSKFKTYAKRQTIPKPEFNWGSSQQLGGLLYEKLKLPGKKGKVTKTGKQNWVTDREALEEIEHLHPVVAKIVEITRLNTYSSTFINGILERAEGDRIYPEFKVNGTDTGRISHTNPNMGNMPARHPKWNRIRNMFLPDEGETIAKADYSQLEVCIAAHYSMDRNLLRIVLEGASQHDITAQGLGISRDTAKPVNFGMQYGATEMAISRVLNCSQAEAKHAINKYWETYTGMRKYLDQVLYPKLERGQDIVSLFGRRRRFFGYRNAKPWVKASMQRKAWSFEVQGTGGDLMNMSFYKTSEDMKARKWGRGGWTVHDEGIIFPKKEHDEEAYQLLCHHMVNVGKEMNLNVPLRTEGESNLSRWKK